MLIDTHCHLYLPEFGDDRAEMIGRAQKEGVRKFLLPAIDSGTHEQMLELETGYPGACLAMMGVHPCSIRENYKEQLEIAQSYFQKRAFIAVGEIGLDFYWDKTYTDQQYEAFHEQIGWAIQYKIPIVIHSRESIDECIGVVKQYEGKGLRGVFHCFSGDIRQAEAIIALGFNLGIGGVVTFKNSGLDRVMEQVSMEKVVLETDSPYLAPVPFRGKRNESSYLKYVVEKLAVIKGVAEEEIKSVTTRNAMKLFKIK
jgi:TatD DNase family protein